MADVRESALKLVNKVVNKGSECTRRSDLISRITRDTETRSTLSVQKSAKGARRDLLDLRCKCGTLIPPRVSIVISFRKALTPSFPHRKLLLNEQLNRIELISRIN